MLETKSGLLVPENAVVQSSEVNPYNILFPSEATADSFIDRCVVRWDYYVGILNISTSDTPEWKTYARRDKGVVHDSQSSAYTNDAADCKLRPFVTVKYVNNGYAIVNKEI